MSKVVKQGYTFDKEHSVAIPDSTEEELPGVDSGASQTMRDNAAYKIIVQKAKEEAEVMAQNIVMGAIRQKDSLLQEAVLEGEKIKKTAQEQGYADGYAKAVADSSTKINGIIERTSIALNGMNTRLDDYFKFYEENATDVIIDIADKIMMTRLQKDNNTLIPLIRRAIAEIGTGAGDVTLKISSSLDDIGAFLADLPKHVIVKTVDAELGMCSAESKLGAVDLSIEAQLKKLKQRFKMKKKK